MVERKGMQDTITYFENLRDQYKQEDREYIFYDNFILLLEPNRAPIQQAMRIGKYGKAVIDDVTAVLAYFQEKYVTGK